LLKAVVDAIGRGEVQDVSGLARFLARMASATAGSRNVHCRSFYNDGNQLTQEARSV